VCSEIIVTIIAVELISKMNHFVKFDVSDYMNFVNTRITDAILIFAFVTHEYFLSRSIIELFDFLLENVNSRL
jgi:hypothetical protein